MVLTIASMVLFCATAFCIVKIILMAHTIISLEEQLPDDRSTVTLDSLRKRWLYWRIACAVLAFIGLIVFVVK